MFFTKLRLPRILQQPPFISKVLSLFLPTELSRLANAVNQGEEFRNHVLFDFHQGVQCLNENLFDLLLRQMPRTARLEDYFDAQLL